MEEVGVSTLKTYHSQIRVQTSECLQFIDLTKDLTELVARSGVRHGWVNVQTRHTTTALIVNENEPLLLDDLRRMLD
ncbi:MAG: YjbQ family protein, partial [Blastocatellia bacterium]